MKKSLSRNYIYNVIYQILTLLLPIVTTPYVARILSVDSIGIYSYTYSIAAFFVIVAELGSAVYARREIAYYQDDKNKRSIFFWEIFIFRVLMTILCLFFYYIYILQAKHVEVALAQILYIIAVMFDITWLFQGMENFLTVVIKNSIAKIITMICIFTFVKSNNDLLIYVFCLAIVPLISNVITWSGISKYIERVPLKKLRPLRHFKGTMQLFIPTIAAQVYLLLDKTMLGFFTEDNIENGYYEQAQKIIRICWTFLTTLATVMAPRIASLYAKGDKETLKRYMCSSFDMVWCMSFAMSFGIIAIANHFVPCFFGVAYNKVVLLLVVFSFILFPIGINSVIGSQFLVTIKKHKIYTISIISGAIFNFVLNLILIPKYFSIGAAISSILAEYVITIIQAIYVVYYIKEIKITELFIHVWQYALAGTIMLITVKCIGQLFDISIGYTMLLILIGIVTYFVVLLLVHNRIVLDTIKQIKRKISKEV